MDSAPLVNLRALEPDDIDLLYMWENDPATWDAGGTLAPYSRQQLTDYVMGYDGDIFAARQLRLMIDYTAPDGNVHTVGTVDLFDFDPANSRAGVGILVIPGYQRRGIATEALHQLAGYCRTRLSMHQLHAVTAIDNTASRRTFERAGFTPSGRLRSWLRHTEHRYIDAFIYQKML